MAISNIIQIGRGADSDVILQSAKVSKKHAIIYAEDGCLYIEDVQSANGTFVDGRRVTGKEKIAFDSSVVLGDAPVDMKLVQSKITYQSPEPKVIIEKEVTISPNNNCQHCGAENAADALICNSCHQPIQGLSSETEWSLFIGTNVHKYLPSFMEFESGGSRISWCWPGFIFNYLWLAYRKMYVQAAAVAAIMMLLFMLQLLVYVKMGAPVVPVIAWVAQFGMVVALGMYGKYLYYGSMLKKLAAMRGRDHLLHADVLQRNGGTKSAAALLALILFAVAQFVVVTAIVTMFPERFSELMDYMK
jgi:hypothetical protein